MRLVVKQNDVIIKELNFHKGPIYIGRHEHSQVILSDNLVSRRHAVLVQEKKGNWFVEDLDSANGTYLNSEQLERAEIKDGDVIKIADFMIAITLNNNHFHDTLHLSDTIVAHPREQNVIIRKTCSKDSPDLRVPASRIKEYTKAAEMLCQSNVLVDVAKTLVKVVLNDLAGYHCWVGLGDEMGDELDYCCGKNRSGQLVDIKEIKLRDKIIESMEKSECMLFPRLLLARGKRDTQSAMIVPIVGVEGCCGVIYVDNTLVHEHYTMLDLDYVVLLAIHSAAVMRNF